MDGYFQFLIPAGANLEPFYFVSPEFKWKGIAYPQGNEECNFGSNFKLIKQNEFNIKFIENKLPISFKNMQWQTIEILGNGIDIFIANLYGLKEEEQGYTFKNLISLLLKNKKKWAAIFSPQYDGFNEVTKASIEDVILKFEYSIKVSRKGFMLYS